MTRTQRDFIAFSTLAWLLALVSLPAPGLAAEAGRPAESGKGAPAATLPKGVKAVTSVEGIDEYGLENGLRVLLFPDPTKETVTVNITYLVGSRHEGYGETGMAHLLEHLLFKGTPKHPDIPKELTAHGCRPNGTTWLDRTNYFETFPATDENLAWALDLEADRMVNSFVAQKDLDSEMTVVRNEFEIGRERSRGSARESACSPPPTSGTTTGSPRSVRGRTSRTWRSRTSRPSIGSTTSPTTRCLIVAGDFDVRSRPRDDCQYVRQDPAPRAHAARGLHDRARAGRRAQRDAAPGRRYAHGRPWPTTFRPARMRTSPRSTS